jgi:biotin carboxyl carrier protein
MVDRGARNGDGSMARVGDSPRGTTANDLTDRVVRVSFPNEPAGSAPPMVVEPHPDGRVTVDGTDEAASILEVGASRLRLTTVDGIQQVIVSRIPGRAGSPPGVERLEVVIGGWRFEVDLEPERRAELRERATSARGADARGGPLELRAIIPGRVVSVDVAAGDVIEPGGRLLVVEAMKMQNELRSPRGGTVGRIAVGPGQTVERGDVLLVIE